ncbi:hypothetical protein ACYQR9_05770 [Methylobacterium sp. CM6241]
MSEYVLNIASIDVNNDSLRDATRLITSFVETLAELDTQMNGAPRALKLPREPWDIYVAVDDDGSSVSLGEIVNGFYENGATRELAVFFDAMRFYAPAVDQLDEQAIEAILRLTPSCAAEGQEGIFEAVCEAGHEAMQCVVTGGTLVGLAKPKWDFDLGAVTCDQDVVTFDHASCVGHVDAISQRVRRAAQATVTRRNFLAYRQTAFPSLIWGEEVDDQITVFPSEYLGLAFSRLANLDDMARRWSLSGDAEPDSGVMELCLESKITMDNYGDNRRFRSASGVMRTYETHVWIDRGNRVHVFLDKTNRTVEVGYVGKHLPTWNYQT